MLVGGLIALIVALLGGLGFVLLQGGDDTTADDPPDTREEDEEEEEDEPEVTDPPVTDPPVTEPPVTDPPVTDPPVSDPPEPDGSVQNIFVRVEAFDALVADEDLTPTFQELATREGDNPVATTDDVINLCAAMPLDADVNASVEWVRDGTTVLAGDPIDLFAPGDGACLNNSGDPLVAGSYEVSFTDAAGAMSGVALFTVGSETVTQTFVNDTGVEVCSVDAGPTPAGFYQTFELASGASLPVGDSILFDVAAVEHEARAVDCDDNPLESFFFTPSGEDVNLSTGELTNPPPADISDLEFVALDGEIGSLDLAVTSPDDVAEVLDILLTAEDRLRIATTDTALTLCVGWDVPGALEADIVWEFNRVEVARIPAVAEDGRIGGCVPPGGAEFDEGAYQAYLSRGELISTVETYTVGREETQLAFVNDTGVEICEVGFSPTLTNFYTFFVFAESSEFEGALAPGDSFTIVAPFIESDIRGRDCEGNNVSEAFGIPPTDQVLNLTDGQP